MRSPIARPSRHDCRRAGHAAASVVATLVLALVAALVLAAGAHAQERAQGAVAVFGYDRRAPLDLRDSLVRTTPAGVAVHRVSFASPKGGRATGYLAVPPATLRGAHGRFAGLLHLHGAPGSAERTLEWVEPMARYGAVVLTLDAPFARRDPESPLRFTVQDSVDQVQLLVDLQRAVDVLVARPDVDPARLGFTGGSYGGAMGALLAGVERRVRTYALDVADAGVAAHFTDPAGRRIPPPEGIPAAAWCRWYSAMEPLSATRFLAGATHAEFLFQWGRQDPLVPPHLARHLLAAVPGGAMGRVEARYYDSGHALPIEAFHRTMAWLTPRLGLAPAAGTRPTPPVHGPG